VLRRIFVGKKEETAYEELDTLYFPPKFIRVRVKEDEMDGMWHKWGR
jgi:hypothetical protein